MRQGLRRALLDVRRHGAWRLAVASVAVAVATSACGSDDDTTESPQAEAPTEVEDSGLEKYCERSAEYLEATEAIDPSDVASILDGFGGAATAARGVADVAPPQVREAHERLAGAAEELIAGLRARAPQTREDLEAANQEILDELTPKYGDLEKETDQAQSFAAKECGLSFE